MIQIDYEKAEVREIVGQVTRTYPFATSEAFQLVSKAWLRVGWDTKYVYGFTWLGRPIIQLPDDLIRLQEVIFRLKPDVIIETGIAHGGSLIFSASLCQLIGKGRVIGIDIDIREKNRKAIEAHPLASSRITMIEGSSVSPEVVRLVSEQLTENESVLVLLDSCHNRDHVFAELESYGKLVTVGSYIVAMDGIMADVVGAPRSQPDWATNNPQTAVRDFLKLHPEFILEEPERPFNEGLVTERVTYWPNSFLKRVDPS